MAQRFSRMVVCGVGLIGGSLAWAVRRRRLVEKVVGLGRTRANLEVALSRGMLDEATSDPAEAAGGADLVVLATPIVSMPAVLAAMTPDLARRALITDVGSVKRWVVEHLEPLLGEEMALVGAHPVTGKAERGASAADPGLFENQRVIVTPSARSTGDASKRISALWRSVGARVETMDVETHDRILARVSHLPQIVSSALAAALSEERVDGKPVSEFGAGGLRDMTRLAGSSWEMWRGIFLTNRESIVAALRLYGSTLKEFERLIEAGDMERLAAIFERGRRIRGGSR